jgi:cytoplasmic iron level regulating protein YaaA (DUF328/UPF0246 family)
VLILLPPSESKHAPRRGKALDLGGLSFPALEPTRRRVLTSLVDLCQGDPARARAVLGLTAGQRDEIERNAGLLSAPTTTVGQIYTGVLYDALGLATVSPAGKRRAATRIAVTSGLFGLLRLADRIPAYRLSGTTSLPGLGTLASVWRGVLGDVIEVEARRGLVVDLRSGTYAGFWRPGPGNAVNLVTVRVLQDVGGVRAVVSHFNKATKGHLVRALLEDGANPGTARALAKTLSALGWRVELSAGSPPRLDVIVTEI